MSAKDEIAIIRGRRFVVCDCGTCGVPYTVPEVRYQSMRTEGGFAHCPNGHAWGWKEGTKQRDELRAERDRLKQALAQRDDEIAELRAAEANATQQHKRTMKRVHAGVCPCCNRTFKNLARHMASKHPERSAQH